MCSSQSWFRILTFIASAVVVSTSSLHVWGSDGTASSLDAQTPGYDSEITVAAQVLLELNDAVAELSETLGTKFFALPLEFFAPDLDVHRRILAHKEDVAADAIKRQSAPERFHTSAVQADIEAMLFFDRIQFIVPYLKMIKRRQWYAAWPALNKLNFAIIQDISMVNKENAERTISIMREAEIKEHRRMIGKLAKRKEWTAGLKKKKEILPAVKIASIDSMLEKVVPASAPLENRASAPASELHRNLLHYGKRLHRDLLEVQASHNGSDNGTTDSNQRAHGRKDRLHQWLRQRWKNSVLSKPVSPDKLYH